MSALKIMLVTAAAAYGAIVVLMFLFQRNLQYHPENKGLTPESVGLSGVEDMTIATPDGERIRAWHLPAPEGRPTILFFQGNAGEIGDRPARMQFYGDNGFGALFVSYRGFGGSSGTMSEAGLVSDGVAAYDWLTAQGVSADRILVVGESLGTGVAVQLAAQRSVAALALEAPYTATVDVGAEIYWWLPVRLLMKDRFLSRDHIRNVRAPVLIVHGDADRLIPVAHGQRLFELASEPKEIEIIPGGRHDVILEPEVWTREVAFFERVLARQ
ncbi:MAG: alpha/beta hydrolase [Aestuariivirga sp.]